MHSTIFQISTKPIPENEWVEPERFFEELSWSFDSVGEEALDSAEREERITNFFSYFNELFEYNGNNEIVFKGIKVEFLRKWARAINVKAFAVDEDNVLQYGIRRDIERVLTQTHKGGDCRFYIPEWDGGEKSHPIVGLISWLADYVKEGSKLYVGAAIDFHI